MIRRIAGLALLIIGLAGVVLAVAGFVVSGRVVDAVGQALDDTLGLTSNSLTTVGETLVLAQTTLADVNAGLDTVEETAVSLADTLADSRPLLEQVTQITSEDAPNSIEAVQAAIPNVAEVAGVIDDTLITLNDFRIDESFLGIVLQYDLGVNYAPTQPFDETVNELGESLDGLPAQLRSLEPSLTAANENLAVVSANVVSISEDLNVINGRIAEVGPLLDQYINIVDEINGTAVQTQTAVRQQLNTAKIALQVVMVWLGFMQFALLYLGWDLLTRRDYDDVKQEESQ